MSGKDDTEIIRPELLSTHLELSMLSISPYISKQVEKIERNKVRHILYQHKKSGGIYQIIGYCMMQVNSDLDMAFAVIYQNVDDFCIWCRPKKEFDERFEIFTETSK